MYKKLQVFNVYNLMNLDLYIHTYETITIKAINLSIISESFLLPLLFFNINFSILVRALNINISLSKFLSMQYRIINYSPHVVRQISRTYSPCITETLCPSTDKSPFPLPLVYSLVIRVWLLQFFSLPRRHYQNLSINS